MVQYWNFRRTLGLLYVFLSLSILEIAVSRYLLVAAQTHTDFGNALLSIRSKFLTSLTFLASFLHTCRCSNSLLIIKTGIDSAESLTMPPHGLFPKSILSQANDQRDRSTCIVCMDDTSRTVEVSAASSPLQCNIPVNIVDTASSGSSSSLRCWREHFPEAVSLHEWTSSPAIRLFVDLSYVSTPRGQARTQRECYSIYTCLPRKEFILPNFKHLSMVVETRKYQKWRVSR